MSLITSDRRRMAVLLLLLIYVHFVCSEYREVEFIQKLNSYFDFDHNIFLFDVSIDMQRFIDTASASEHLTPRSLYQIGVNGENLTGPNYTKVIKSKNALMVVILSSVKQEENLKLMDQVKAFQLRQVSIKIGIFYLRDLSVEDLSQLFTWSWSHRIVKLFAVAQPKNISSGIKEPAEVSLNVFTFNPFEKLKVINLTDADNMYDHLFLSENSNFQQYPLILLDLGLVRHFEKTFWLTVSLLINASYTILTLDKTTDDIKMWTTITRLTLRPSSTEVQYLYPLEMTQIMVVVPEALPYFGFASYLKVLTTYHSLGYSILFCIVVISFLSVIRFKKQKKCLILESVADVFNLLVNDNTYIKYQQLSIIEVMVIVPLTFAGFVVVNVTLSTLKSYFTQPIIQPQIDSIEDLYKSLCLIGTNNPGWTDKTIIELTNQLERYNWADKVLTMNNTEYNKQVSTFNTSMCFIGELTNALHLLRVQKRLNIYGFHISRVRVSAEHFAYILSPDFPFTERLNEIVHWVSQSGLYEKWKDEFYVDYEKQIKKIYSEKMSERNNDKNTVAESDDLSMIMRYILYGWIASATVFVSEIVWKRIKVSKMFRR